ncbi:MAG TPA: tRNA (N6-threonylcarbamoyladenosine(37)-N6)-methyltransferase TrmO [Chlamydiales bacterium]|nr:tRNA (N6-threonylcarbamoyladenosine(37)-N6)-methyltransferase TrmO [Chlamydiales bacterium]
MDQNVTTKRESNEELLVCQPIGYFHSAQSEKYMASKQAVLGEKAEGKIILNPHCNFEQALSDMEGFQRIWVLFWLHHNTHWKPKVLTPRGGQKRGLFATRSPHRPNPIGMSAIELLRVGGREIFVGASDLLDGTPILDIKPYVPYADAFEASRAGWIDGMSERQYQVEWSDRARKQGQWIEERLSFPFFETVELRLKNNPLPFPSHRIHQVGDNEYVLAVKSWRVCYGLNEDMVHIVTVRSGYDQDTMDGKKESKWDDVKLHKAFQGHFKAV